MGSSCSIENDTEDDVWITHGVTSSTAAKNLLNLTQLPKCAKANSIANFDTTVLAEAMSTTESEAIKLKENVRDFQAEAQLLKPTEVYTWSGSLSLVKRVCVLNNRFQFENRGCFTGSTHNSVKKYTISKDFTMLESHQSDDDTVMNEQENDQECLLKDDELQNLSLLQDQPSQQPATAITLVTLADTISKSTGMASIDQSKECIDQVEAPSDAEVDIYVKAYFAFYVELVKTLPMNDTIFMAELTPHFFAVGDLKERVQAEITRHAKAAYFLDNAIKPSLDGRDITSFQMLLSIMNCGYQTSVAEAIRNKIREQTFHRASLFLKRRRRIQCTVL